MLTLASLVLTTLAAADIPSRLCGSWRAVLSSPGGELPFELVLSATPPRARIRNGAETIEVPEASVAGDELTLRFPDYDARVLAHVAADGKLLEGFWEKRGAGDKLTSLPFRATAGTAPRFAPERGAPADVPDAPGVSGRWLARFERTPAPLVALFEQHGSALTGTFLTTTGDFRYLAGSLEGGHLRLSCFDGAHAFLFDARLADGKLAGSFHSGDTWQESWSAVRDEAAALPDAWKQCTWNGSVPVGLMTFPDLDGQEHALSEWLGQSRALILVVLGSWCPNCHDELRDLAQLDRRLRPSGLAIVGLAFEHGGDFARDAEVLRRTLEREQVLFPVLLAGRSEKLLAAQALPSLSAFEAFPTTIFLHRDGRARAVHSGYSGPGTGALHDALVQQFEHIAQELLDEPDADNVVSLQKLASGRWIDQPHGFLTTIFVNGAVAQYLSDDPGLEPKLEQRHLRPLRLRGSLVLFEDNATYVWDPGSPALLDPFDVGHRLGGELPSNTPVAAPALPVYVGNIDSALRAGDARLRRDALFSAARAWRTGLLRTPIDPTPWLADPDPQVRCQAAWAAGELGTKAAVPKLIEASADGFAPLRRECAHALGRIGAPEARGVLEALAKDLDPRVRAYAATALSSLPK